MFTNGHAELREWTGKHYRTGEVVTVRAVGGTIKEIAPSAAETDVWVAPGLIDVQVNGMGGFSLSGAEASPENLHGTLRALNTGGVTRFCPTVVTGTRERMVDNVRAIAEACDADPAAEYAVIGIHVEGPFISHEDGPRGTHNAAWVRSPDWDEFQEWQEAAGGRVRKVTVAPEKDGAIRFIEKLVDSGVVAAIGHCAASVEEVQAAVKAGATMSTHLGNGAHPYIKRHPNYIWAQLAEESLWAGLIPDGFHLPPSTLKVMIKVKGRRAILASDASYLAQMAPGTYRTHHGTEVVLQEDGRLHVAATPDILAGSAATLQRGVQNVANFGIASVADAITMASLHPAELFGLDGVGRLEAGSPADLITYRWSGDTDSGEGEFTVTSTVAAGETRSTP
jgi:N-acetylglucosamine-6-phosphate deacetylase